MMKIIESKNEIILRDRPVFYWILGAILSLTFGFLLVWLASRAYYEPRSVFKADDGSLLGSALVVIVFLLTFAFVGGFIYLFFSLVLMPTIIVKVNRTSQIVEIINRNFWQSKTQRFYFSQIKGFDRYKMLDTDFAPLFITLILANDSEIRLEMKKNSDIESKNLVEKLNSFIS